MDVKLAGNEIQLREDDKEDDKNVSRKAKAQEINTCRREKRRGPQSRQLDSGQNRFESVIIEFMSLPDESFKIYS